MCTLLQSGRRYLASAGVPLADHIIHQALVDCKWSPCNSVYRWWLFCIAVLRVAPQDQDAISAKVAVLLEAGKYSEVLDFVERPRQRGQFQFEKVMSNHGVPV